MFAKNRKKIILLLEKSYVLCFYFFLSGYISVNLSALGFNLKSFWTKSHNLEDWAHQFIYSWRKVNFFIYFMVRFLNLLLNNS